MGEFGLIDRLTKGYEKKNESTVYGVGDDCAVMHYPDKEVLITTDMLMEGVHFDLTYIDMAHLGYKSAMVNISDIFIFCTVLCTKAMFYFQIICAYNKKSVFHNKVIRFVNRAGCRIFNRNNAEL